MGQPVGQRQIQQLSRLLIPNGKVLQIDLLFQYGSPEVFFLCMEREVRRCFGNMH